MSPPPPRRVAIYGPPGAWATAFRAARHGGERVVGLFAAGGDAEDPELQRALRHLRERRYDALILQLEP